MIGLFFGGGAFKTKFGNALGNIELDANLEETHEWSALVTESPVEDGSPVSDHVIEQPDKLSIRGFISETPITASPSILGIIGTSDASSRTQKIFDLLRDLIKSRLTMTVYTKHRTYPDMVLTSVRTPRTPADGESIEFTAEFTSVRFVSASEVDVPKGISAKGATADKGTARKSAATKDGGKAAVAKQDSAMAKLTSFLKGLF